MDSAERAIIGLARPEPDFSTIDFSSVDMSEFQDATMRHKLFMLIYGRLAGSVGTCASEKVRDFLSQGRHQYLHTSGNSMRMEAVEKDVICLLAADGIDAIVIKGNALAREIYNDPNCRMSADIDILIRSRDARRATVLMIKSEYMPDQNEPLGFLMQRLHHETFYHAGSGVTVELHWNFGIPGFFDLSSDDIWNEVLYADGAPCGLSPEMAIVLLLMHHYMHFFRDLWVLVDVHHALNCYSGSIDPGKFAHRLVKTGLVKTTLITLRQIDDLWGCATDNISLIAALRGALEDVGPKPMRRLFAYFRMDMARQCSSHSHMDRLVARFALDKRGVIFRSFVKTFLPPPQAVMKYYGDTRRLALPYNYIKFILGRVREWVSGKG
jgi:hypothetical protein